jgi:hypothetical protein
MTRIAVFLLTVLLLQQQALAEQPLTQVQTDLYSETLHDFLSENIINFQRLQLLKPVDESGRWKLYGSLIHERYTDQSLFSFEGGVKGRLTPELQFLLGARRLNINVPDFTDTQVRAGLIFAHRWNLPLEKTALETYGELFLLTPFKDRVQLAGSGWIHLFYTAYEKNYWIVDAPLLELRTYRASNPAYAGESYSALSLGPRVAYWWPVASGRFGSASLYLAESYVWARGREPGFQNWFLFTLGVEF